MVVLHSDTGIVPATEREMALSLDLTHLQVRSIEEERVISPSLTARLSTQYDNC